MSGVITGSCLCGAVRFALEREPVWAHSCHCSRCRKTSGAACATNLFVPIDGLRYTQGEEHLRSYKPPEAERFTHVFCALCGSTLPFANKAFKLAGVPMGSLDDDPRQRLRAHIFVDSLPPWFAITDDLPQHPTGLGSADEGKD